MKTETLIVISALALCCGSASSSAWQTPPEPDAAAEGTPAFAGDQQLGQRFDVRLDALPKPYTEGAVRNPPLLVPRGARKPILPPGFETTCFAENLKGPRQLLILPNGDVLVSIQAEGHLLMMRDEDGDGRADWIQRHASNFTAPYGMALRDGEILIADMMGIWRIDYTPGLLRPPYAHAEPIGQVPPDQRKPSPYMDGQSLLTKSGVFGIVQGHFNRDLEIGPDGRLYVGVGSAGNIGVEPEPKCTIQSFAASGQDQRTVAAGMRNPCGLAFHPTTGKLWALVQERDGTGDNLVPDYLTEVKDGGFYGFPFAYIGPNPQPGFAELAPEKVAQTVVPDLLFAPHSATMDLAFYDKTMFPERFRGGAFLAMKGSWNRTQPTGYKVVFVPFGSDGRPSGGYENFATGFWVGGSERAEVWGRPSDVAVAPDGALFICDDTGGTIWRITYRGAAGAHR